LTIKRETVALDDFRERTGRPSEHVRLRAGSTRVVRRTLGRGRRPMRPWRSCGLQTPDGISTWIPQSMSRTLSG